jgi:hypothetical protein
MDSTRRAGIDPFQGAEFLARQRRFFKMGQGDYFWAEWRAIGIDLRLGEVSATCCGVNLAFAGFGCGCGEFGSRSFWYFVASGEASSIQGTVWLDL